MSPDGGGPQAEHHKAREVELHRLLAEGYRLRYGPPFARIFQQFWNDELLALLPGRIAGAVLDAGCGTGILLSDLLARCESVYGVDLSPEMLEQARARAPAARELRVGDLEALPYPDGSFTAVVMRGSLHHAASQPRALAEVSRVLAPGGQLALTEPSDDFPPVRWARAALYRRSSRFDPHDRAMRRRTLDAMLRAAGMEPLAWKRFGYLSYLVCGFPDVFPLILHLPARAPLARALVAIDRVASRLPILRVASFHLMALARKPESPRGSRDLD